MSRRGTVREQRGRPDDRKLIDRAKGEILSEQLFWCKPY